MRHLTDEQLLDIAEDMLAPRPAHLATCAACRQQVDDLRRTLSAVQAVDVPEPSPLFWDHLSSRVRDAVAADRTPAMLSRWTWLSWRATAGLSAAAALLMLTLVTRDAPVMMIRPPDAPTVASVETASTVSGADVVDADDPSLTLLADLTGGLEWDDAAEAGIVVGSGAADSAVAELNADERIELRRLLNEALTGGSGVI